MKRITTLLLAAMFAVSGMMVAQASDSVDVKVRGAWDFAFGWAIHTGFTDKHDERQDDNFLAVQRVRTQVNFIVSENLQAVVQFEIGTGNWGRGANTAANNRGSYGRNSGFGLSADGVNLETKHLYLDWMVPETALHIRMGLQPMLLPSLLGSTVLDDDLAAITASYPINDTFALTAFWGRPADHLGNDNDVTAPAVGNVNHSLDDETDAFGLIAPITLDGVTITPWFMYANIGSFALMPGGTNMNNNGDNTSNASAWWLGLVTEVTLYDPLTFGVEFLYGTTTRLTGYDTVAPGPGNQQSYSFKTSGWYIAANLDYALDWGTPGIFGWYSSGDDEGDVRDNKYGRILAVSPSFLGSTFAWDDVAVTTGDVLGVSNQGTWAIGIQIADMSFIEDLTHTLRFTYINGTNDPDIVRNARRGAGVNWDAAGFINDMEFLGASGQYMTTKDHAYEVTFDHRYQIYENLAAVLELGYIHMDRSDSVWGRDFQDENAWKAQVWLQFRF